LEQHEKNYEVIGSGYFKVCKLCVCRMQFWRNLLC